MKSVGSLSYIQCIMASETASYADEEKETLVVSVTAVVADEVEKFQVLTGNKWSCRVCVATGFCFDFFFLLV